MTTDQPVILRSDAASKSKVKSQRPLSIINESSTDDLDPESDADWLISAAEEHFLSSTNKENSDISAPGDVGSSLKDSEKPSGGNISSNATAAITALGTDNDSKTKESKREVIENASAELVDTSGAKLAIEAVQYVPESYSQTSSYRSTRRLAVAPLQHPVVALGHYPSLTDPQAPQNCVEQPLDVGISSQFNSLDSNFSHNAHQNMVQGHMGNVDGDFYSNRSSSKSNDLQSPSNILEKQGVQLDSHGEGQFRDANRAKNEKASENEYYTAYRDEEQCFSSVHPWSSSREDLKKSTSNNDFSPQPFLSHINSAPSFGSNNIHSTFGSSSVNTRDSCSNYVNSDYSTFISQLSPQISRGRTREVKNDRASPKNGKLIDTEQLMWRDKVKRCHSLSMPEKFRPIVRSKSSFDTVKQSSQNLDSDSCTGQKSHGHVKDDTQSISEKTQFYLNGSSPTENEPVSAKGKDVVESAYPTTPLSHVSPRFSKFTSLGRKLSWQGQRDRGSSLSPRVQRKFSTDNISSTNLSQSYPRTQSQSPSLSRRLFLEQPNIDANINSPPTNQSNPVPPRRISAIDQSDFTALKATTNRLNLPTRRPSTLAWRAKYLDNDVSLKQWKHDTDNSDSNTSSPRSPDKLYLRSFAEKGFKDAPLSVERKTKIDEKLSWLREELIKIRLQDQSLAKEFLKIRKTMNDLRLAAKCKEHEELIEDAEEDMEDLREFSRLVDIPPELFSPLPSLQQIGVTRMNITARRYSTC